MQAWVRTKVIKNGHDSFVSARIPALHCQKSTGNFFIRVYSNTSPTKNGSWIIIRELFKPRGEWVCALIPIPNVSSMPCYSHSRVPTLRKKELIPLSISEFIHPFIFNDELFKPRGEWICALIPIPHLSSMPCYHGLGVTIPPYILIYHKYQINGGGVTSRPCLLCPLSDSEYWMFNHLKEI